MSLASIFTYASTAAILQTLPDFKVEELLEDSESTMKLFPGLATHDIKNFFNVIIIDDNGK